jgi:integrase
MAASETAMNQFRDRIVGRRVAESTAEKYCRWARRFEMWRPSGDPDLDTLIDFDSVLADPDWTDYPWENATGRPAPDEYAYRSRRVALSAVKLWTRIHHGNRIREEVQNITSGEPDPFDPPYLSEGDVESAIREAPDACDCTGCRAALQVTYDAILRAAEMVTLSRDDVDLSAGTLDVQAVKGSMNATVSLSDQTVRVLKEHIEANGVNGRLFTNTYGNGWKASSWCSHFRTNHHEAGVHSFGRHTPIVHRLQSGEPFGDVYRRARHQHPTMTTRYARLVGVEVPDWADA